MPNPPTTRASLLLRLCHPPNEQAWQEFMEIYEPQTRDSTARGYGITRVRCYGCLRHRTLRRLARQPLAKMSPEPVGCALHFTIDVTSGQTPGLHEHLRELT